MNFARRSHSPIVLALTILLSTLALSPLVQAEPSTAAVNAFQNYAARLEARLDQERRGQHLTLPAQAATPPGQARLRQGELVIENLTPANEAEGNGALLHHWRGTAFAPGVHAADFERVMQSFAAYPQVYAPQVVQAKMLSHQGDNFQVRMRVRQKHVLTVVMDTSYNILFGRVDAHRGYSISRSTEVREIDNPGSRNERALGSSEEHGFLWRLNTYWSYEERDGGLYVQIESVTLTRAIPTGLGWAIKPFVESVPRESLEFTLRATCAALRKPSGQGLR